MCPSSARSEVVTALHDVLGEEVGTNLGDLLPSEVDPQGARSAARSLNSLMLRQGTLDFDRAPLLYIGQEVGDGASGTHHGFRRLAAKRNTDRFPYTVINEWVGSELGRLLGLPVPRPSLFVDPDGEVWFMSEWMESAPADADTKEVHAGLSARKWRELLTAPQRSRLVHGMVLYDMLVGNNDRRPANLLLDSHEGVWLYDFGNAFFYRPCQFTPSNRNRYIAGAQAGEEVPSGPGRLAAVHRDPRHALDRLHGYLDLISNWAEVDYWTARFAQLPAYLVDLVLDAIPATHWPTTGRDALHHYVVQRLQDFGSTVEQCCAQGVFDSLPSRRA